MRQKKMNITILCISFLSFVHSTEIFLDEGYLCFDDVSECTIDTPALYSTKRTYPSLKAITFSRFPENSTLDVQTLPSLERITVLSSTYYSNTFIKNLCEIFVNWGMHRQSIKIELGDKNLTRQCLIPSRKTSVVSVTTPQLPSTSLQEESETRFHQEESETRFHQGESDTTLHQEELSTLTTPSVTAKTSPPVTAKTSPPVNVNTLPSTTLFRQRTTLVDTSHTPLSLTKAPPTLEPNKTDNLRAAVIGVSIALVIAVTVIIILVVLRLRKKKARKLTCVISPPSFSEEQLQDTSFSSSLATAGQTNTIPASHLSEDQEEVVEFEMDRIAPLPPHNYNTRWQKKQLQQLQ